MGKLKAKNYKISLAFRLLAKVTLFLFVKIFRIKANISPEIKNINEPYILLSNHVGFWDPFVVSYFIKKKPHFVSSDAVLKDPIKRFFLNGYKIIPKKKNMRDSKMVREMIDYIKHGEAIGLFPEATRTWSGKSLHIDESIGKLIKLLNIPVITVTMKGMFLFNPRWANKIRRAALEIDYKIIANKDEIKILKYNELTKLIRTNLQHSETEFQKLAKIKIQSNKRAEFLNYTLFYCPNCNTFHGFFAKKNSLTCKNCGFKIHVDKYNFLHTDKPKALPFSDIEQAFKLQTKLFTHFVFSQIQSKNKEMLFSEKEMLIYKSEKENDFQFLGNAEILFYINRIEVLFENKSVIELQLTNIQTLNPQLRERIELNIGDEAYRFVGSQPGISGIKWEFAANVVWKQLAQEYKISTYFKDLI